MKKLLFVILGTVGLGCAAQAATTTTLNPLTTFGPLGDGTVQPGVTYPPWPPVTVGSASSGYQRGYAYDPTTGNLVLVDPNTGSNSSTNFLGGIYIIDGTYGTNISTLDTNGISGGNYTGSGAGVAADGKVYVCNQVNSSASANFVIYSWTNIWQSNSPPHIAFSGTIAPVQRYGATLDVRGSGTGTQIIIGSKAQSGTSGTNVVIFDTADGVNFTARPLATDVTTADFADGIAFGAGNTFWTKSVSGHALRLMSFNLATSNATTVASFDTNAIAGSFNLGPIALDLNNKLMAGIEVIGTSNPQRVWLFDITATLADSTKPPVLLDIKTFTTQNAFATAPNGFLHFGGGNLYCHAINNGLLTFTPTSGTMLSPTIWNQPSPANKRILTGQKVHYEVVAFSTCSYQWQRNGAAIPGATSAVYNISSAAFGDSGSYTVVVSNAAPGTVTSDQVVLTVVNPLDLYHLTPLWAAGTTNIYATSTGGSGTPNERTIAYNSRSNELFIVKRVGTFCMAYGVDATTPRASTAPPVTKTLNTNGISGGNIPLVGIGVAGDGAIYACNTDSQGNFRLYRWADSGSNTVPATVFSGDPQQPGGGVAGSHFRFGDNMTVRGSGLNTQILIDNQDTGAARDAVVFMPTDSSMTTFSNVVDLLVATFANTIIGRSLQWESFSDLNNNNFWQMHKGSVAINETFDFSGGGIANSNISYGGFPSETISAFNDPAHNLVLTIRTNTGGVNGTRYSVEMYDVTDPTAPVFINSYQFPTGPNANGNCIGQIIVSGNYVWAIAGNNGLVGYQLASGPPAPPAFVTQPQGQRVLRGSNAVFTVSADSIVTSYQWQRITGTTTNNVGTSSDTYSVNNAQAADAASYRCIIANNYGSSTSFVATLTVINPTNTYQVTSAWSASSNSVSYLTWGAATAPPERSIAYNALSNQLIVVSCGPPSAVFSVNIVDGSSGALLYTMDTNGIVHAASEVSGSNPLDLDSVTVDEGGAVYISNLSPNASGGTNSPSANKMFRVYRWADSAASTAPVNIFTGDPGPPVTGNFNYGDSLDARGKDWDTQLILDQRTGLYGVILAPSVADFSVFTNAWFSQPYGGGSIGRSFQFGVTNSFWEKRKGLPLEWISYDLGAQAATVITNYNNGWPSTLGGLNIDYRHNLAAGIDFSGTTGSSPDKLKVYEISDLATPMLIGTYNFPVNHVANDNFIGKVVFGGNRIYALNGNNGMVVVNVMGPTLNVAELGGQAVISWPSSFGSGFTLYSTLSLTSPVTWASEGAGTLIGGSYWVTNDLSAATKFYRLQ